MSNKVLITNEQNAVKVPSGLRILIRRSFECLVISSLTARQRSA